MRLYLSDAVEFVRARMDELSFSNDDMISPADDDRNFDKTVEKLLPEAAEFIDRAAPANLLEPEDVISVRAVGNRAEGIESSILMEDGSIRITIPLESGFLRAVSFHCTDSDIYVTGAVPYDSPEARMQLNPYVRGTHDAPVLTERKVPGKVILTYYSVKDRTNVPGFAIYKIDKPSYADDMSIFCPDFLGPAVLNRLTGMVLDTYKESQHAQTFYQKSLSYIA